MSVIDVIARFKDEGSQGAKAFSDNIGGIATAADKGTISTKSFKDGVEGFGKAIAPATIAIGAMVAGIASSVMAAAEAQQAKARLAQTIESMGDVTGYTVDELDAMATALERSSMFTAEQVMSGQAMLLTFGNIGREALPRTTELMVDMATVFGNVDAAAVQLGKALNDPTKGLTALTRVGVSFTEQQGEQIKALQASGDMLGAQTIILDELTRQFGGQAAAAAETFTGRIQQLNNRVGEAQEAIGMALLPTLVDLGEEVLPVVTEQVEQLAVVSAERLQPAFEDLIDTGRDLSEMLSGAGFDSVTFWGSMGEEIASVNEKILLTQGYLELIQRPRGARWDIITAFGDVGDEAETAGERVEGYREVLERLDIQQGGLNKELEEGKERIQATGLYYDYLIDAANRTTTSTQALTGAYDSMIQTSIINENRMEHYGERLGEVAAEQEAADQAAREWANTLNGIVSGALSNQIGNLEELESAYGDLEAANGEWVTTTINNNGRIATANETLMADLDEDTKKGYQEILNTAAEGGADWLAAYEALQGDLTESQRQALIAQIADLQAHQGETAAIYTGDSEAAEEARNRINAALAEIATGYKTMVLDMIIADAGGVFTEEAAEFAIGAGIMTSSQAAVRLEMQRLTTVEFPQLLQYQRDGRLTAEELGVATDILATSQATSAESAMLQASETGILASKLGEAYTKTVNLKDALLDTQGSYDVDLNYNINTNGSPPPTPGSYSGGGTVPSAPIPQATGGDWLVTSPTLFLAGEAGPERATFTPLGGMGQSGGGGGNTYYTITIDARGAAAGVENNIVRGVNHVMKQYTRTQDGQTRMR